jgi:hypothetical protein
MDGIDRHPMKAYQPVIAQARGQSAGSQFVHELP